MEIGGQRSMCARGTACAKRPPVWALRLPLLLCLLGVCPAAAHEAGLDVYVTTDGDDPGSGTRARPFATLQRARDATRKLRRAGDFPAGRAQVLIRSGIYSGHTAWGDAVIWQSASNET